MAGKTEVTNTASGDVLNKATGERETRAARTGEGGPDRASRGNGSDGTRDVMTGGSNSADPATEGKRDMGAREAIPAAKLDKVWTTESKARWEDDQPSLEDQLKSKRTIDEATAKREAMRNGE